MKLGTISEYSCSFILTNLEILDFISFNVSESKHDLIVRNLNKEEKLTVLLPWSIMDATL